MSLYNDFKRVTAGVAFGCSVVALLGACGGGGGDGGTVGASLLPTVASATVGTARYSQSMRVTLNGNNLDQGISVSSPGCTGMALVTVAPTVSSATTAYYDCRVSAIGAQRVSVQRVSDGAALTAVDYTVAQPQVTLTFSNGAGNGVNGSIVVTLNPQSAPVTVDNFLAYIASGFYVGTVIHRHSPNFVLQGGGYAGPLVAGSPTLPTLKPAGAGIVLEDNAGSNLRYTIAMARRADPDTDSATSQFFINLADNIGLNPEGRRRGYAVFGTIAAGTDVVTAMTAAPCASWPGFLGGTECLPAPNITVTAATQTR